MPRRRQAGWHRVKGEEAGKRVVDKVRDGLRELSAPLYKNNNKSNSFKHKRQQQQQQQ